jgi:hypothetical protein
MVPKPRHTKSFKLSIKTAYSIVLRAFPQNIRMINSAATIPYDIYCVIIRLYFFAIGVCKR